MEILKRVRPSCYGTVVLLSVLALLSSGGGRGSMSPTLQLGDMVIVAKVSLSAIREGDIIEFLQGEMRVIHRVIDVEESDGSRQFITKGDANDSPDMEPVAPS